MGSMKVVAIVAALGLVIGNACALAQHAGHNHPPEHEALHEQFYSTWQMPDAPGISCCNKGDCYPTQARRDAIGWLALRREDGKWLRVPDRKVEQNRDNPDGRNHLCAPSPDRLLSSEVFCFLPGGGT